MSGLTERVARAIAPEIWGYLDFLGGDEGRLDAHQQSAITRSLYAASAALDVLTDGEERAAIVAWLRLNADACSMRTVAIERRNLADAIERGEHHA